MDSDHLIARSKSTTPYLWRSFLILFLAFIVLLAAIFVGARFGLLLAVWFVFRHCLRGLGLRIRGSLESNDFEA